MIYAVFRDLLIDSPDPQGGPWTQQSPFSLSYCTDSSFENITLNGGEAALRMSNCSRCTFNRLNVNLEDTSSGSGIVLNAVGTTTFRNTRIESPGSVANPGYGIYMYGNSSFLAD
jgi:hypothetical protein